MSLSRNKYGLQPLPLNLCHGNSGGVDLSREMWGRGGGRFRQARGGHL